MSNEPKVIDADKFSHPYLNKATTINFSKCDSVGSRTGFEEGGVLVKMEGPACKRFKNGKYEVFISADIIDHLHSILHPGNQIFKISKTSKTKKR